MTDRSSGLYIAIEGITGVGKTTQTTMLADHLKANGYAVRIFNESNSQLDLTARAIDSLINDPHYQMNQTTHLLLLNAIKSQISVLINQARNNGVICLVDYGMLSTVVNQFTNEIPDDDIIDDTISAVINDSLKTLQPDLTIVLDAPANIIADRIKHFPKANSLDNKSIDFWEKIRAAYLMVANQRHYPVIPAIDDINKVHNTIWQLIHNKAAYHSVDLSNQSSVKPPVDKKTDLGSKKPILLLKKADKYTITAGGKAFLDQAITNVSGNVYVFKQNFNPVTAAAAMARLSRRGDDLRITLLDEFSDTQDDDSKLLKRVITAYGDDSVQQLCGQHLVVEGASNLLTKKLEWGRIAAYLEQSTRYIYYDQKDANGHYKYYIPPNLNQKTMAFYVKTMDTIFRKYSKMVHQATDYVRLNSPVAKTEQDTAWLAATRAQACDAVRPVLPVATQSTVGIYASAQAIESMIMHLLADDGVEAREVGQQLLAEARKVIPAFLERADQAERGGATIAYQALRHQQIKKITNQYLPHTYSIPDDEINLVDVYPRNELDIVPDMIYEYSNLSLLEIQKQVEGWSYKQKVKTMQTYFGERLNRRQRPGRALEKIFYSWDIICDYGIFRDLQRHRMVNDLEWQQLTPRYGYEIPRLVEEAGIAEDFIDCFDLSIELYSHLQKAKYELESQYATLLGHKMRWKVTYNAREAFHLHELRTLPQGHPGYRKLVNAMHEKVLNVHPIIAEAMRFVNTAEDPALTRLAAERYTQYKLKKLSSQH